MSQPRRNADGVPLMTNGEPNPTGTGPYCLPPPGICHCGTCPHYTPPPIPDYTRAIAELREKEKGGRRR